MKEELSNPNIIENIPTLISDKKKDRLANYATIRSEYYDLLRNGSMKGAAKDYLAKKHFYSVSTINNIIRWGNK